MDGAPEVILVSTSTGYSNDYSDGDGYGGGDGEGYGNGGGFGDGNGLGDGTGDVYETGYTQ